MVALGMGRLNECLEVWPATIGVPSLLVSWCITRTSDRHPDRYSQNGRF